MASNKRPGGGVEIVIVCFAAILVAACIYVGTMIIDRNELDAVETSNIIRNYGLLALGAIGFPLAIWRSWVAHLQTQEAIEQGRRVERQIQVTEINNLTTLLDKAAALMADVSNEKKRAGVALLRHIGMSPIGGLSQEALDMLTDFIGRNDKNPITDQISLTALKYADHIAQMMGVKIRVRVKFSGLEIKYLPANIYGVIYDTCMLRDLTVGRRGQFKTCDFFECTIKSGPNIISNSKFVSCRISMINLRLGSASSFTYCDFSGCKRANEVTPEMLDKCFYKEGDPPSPKVFDVLGEHLEQRDAVF